jgi:hypothetical protein
MSGYRKSYLKKRLEEHADLEKICGEFLTELETAVDSGDYKRADDMAYDTALALVELDTSKRRVCTGMAMGFCYIKDNEICVDDGRYPTKLREHEKITQRMVELDKRAEAIDGKLAKLKGEGKPLYTILDYMKIANFYTLVDEAENKLNEEKEKTAKEHTGHYIQ